ncbi:hypothetical protein LCG56_28575 (plasmid) [Pseudomonas cannabina pv. alisalensis]|uniref:Uncharacterized protein n=1 Tax=Pseudomonas syringae pv. maculicola str. ES4326 TaxID=629265 RepID=A0A8T8CB44_PSEYM|nr:MULTISPECIES: hypothetical protein [Pseudomonas syringae group]QHF00715.1 hypothetical protein PMA4326_029945 [Pseudomonas syringae pv. maculicola str. ES4326]UBZ00325.1 hypothetical protein LCG56_28575 [Pseudomonas cannabina pv. alisalensis]
MELQLMGKRIIYEIGQPAAAILYSHSSHSSQDPETQFYSLMKEFIGRPTALVIELLSLTYQTSSGHNQEGDPLFTVAQYAGEREYVLIGDVDLGTVRRRADSYIGLAPLPTSFEASVHALFDSFRKATVPTAYSSVESVRMQLLDLGHKLNQAMALNNDDSEVADAAAALHLGLVDLLARRGIGLQAWSTDALMELKSGSSPKSPAATDPDDGRWMPGSTLAFGEEYGILYRDEGETLLVVVDEGAVVVWQREVDGEMVKVEHHYVPSDLDMEKHCLNMLPYKGFTCTHFGDGRAVFTSSEVEASYRVTLGSGWELEAWAGVKVDIDRSLMH